MIDLVVNHTSDQHPWFQEARRDPESKYRDWYVWSKKKPANAKDGVVFPGVQKSTWTYDKEARMWYFHRFYDFQPDLNTANPYVQAELLKIMGFWIQLGVSGFRMDAVPFVIATKGAEVEQARRAVRHAAHVPRVPAMARGRRDHPRRGERAARHRHAVFRRRGRAAADDVQLPGQPEPSMRSRAQIPAAGRRSSRPRSRPATAQWGVFLRNHDELDLGRLPQGSARPSSPRSAPSPDMQLYNRGIRRRLAPMLDGDRRRLELAYSLMLTLPGTPVVRYGDEIGMGDDLRLPERECARTPMQWSTEPHGGFTKTGGRSRVISGGPTDSSA